MKSVLAACLVTAAACRGATMPASTGGDDDGATPDAAVAPGDAPGGLAHCAATDPRAAPVAIVPTPEAGEAPYLAALMPAAKSIRVEIYEMGYGGILDQLTAKAMAGVPVQVIFDQSEVSTNQKYFDQLQAAGAQVKWSSPDFTYQHAKFFTVDDQVAVISTGNYSYTYSINLERNFVATDRDPADVADLDTLFDDDWAGSAVAMDCTRMVLSPINARARILSLIEGAQHTLTIESMQFADSQVRTAVSARVAAGVQVRAILADAGWVTANATAATYLKNLGVEVKFIPHMHTKVIVADGAVAYMGSENLSETSLDHNREVGVIVTDASSLAPLESTFETDWAAGSDF